MFGDEPWTATSGGCGEEGDQIFLGHKSITNGNLTERFVSEWLKYRYGVFDTNGFESDLLYPPCRMPGGERIPTCHDALEVMKNSQLNPGPHAIPQSQYNRYEPTKQNHLCKRRSPKEVIDDHDDWISPTERNERFVEPTFNYVRKDLTRYVVVIDDHLDINVRNSFEFLRDAMRKWIEKDLDYAHSEVGIWLMNKASQDVERNLIKSLKEMVDRETVLNTLPWDIEHKGAPKCLLPQAVTKSAEFLKERARTNGDANSVILVIAPGMVNCSEMQINDMIGYVTDVNIKVTTINYPRIAQNRISMDQLALKTGGKAFTIIEKKQSNERSLLTTFFELTSTLLHIR